MHLLHLAIFPDAILSMMLDLTDHATPHRDQALTEMWENYRGWCESLGVADRARRKLFSSKTLRPNHKEYRTISQKILSASAARYLMMWMKAYVVSLLNAEPESLFLQCLGSLSILCCALCCVFLCALWENQTNADNKRIYG
ncbi:unnamed protein product [Symbiodinium sp. CCMP2592]|nr:unnamed protein product [Symbiodinium sp. CCMP2592]